MDRFTRFAAVAFTVTVLLNFVVFETVDTSFGLVTETVVAVLGGVLLGVGDSRYSTD